jgi:hypothetical protein
MALTKITGEGVGSLDAITIGDGTAADKKILFDGNAVDYHIGLDDSSDSLIIGKGSTLGTTSHMVIDTGGSVTKPLTPFVRLELTSHVSANTTVNSPGNQVTGFTVRENVGSYWNSSNNNFTCPVAGVYSVSIFYIKYPGSGVAHVDLHKNGSAVNAIRWRAPEAGSSYYQAGGTASVTCAANDVLDWHYFGTAGLHDNNGSWEIMLSH